MPLLRPAIVDSFLLRLSTDTHHGHPFYHTLSFAGALPKRDVLEGNGPFIPLAVGNDHAVTGGGRDGSDHSVVNVHAQQDHPASGTGQLADILSRKSEHFAVGTDTDH